MSNTIHARMKKASFERHCLIVGTTGAGKSQLMQGMIWDLIRTSNVKRDMSIVLIEPHGDFSSRIAFSRNIPIDRLKYVSATINREAGVQGYTCIVNPFYLTDYSEEMRYLLTTELTAAIGELLADTTTPLTVQMTMLLRNMISITLKTGKEASLETLCRFCHDKLNSELVELGRHSSNELERLFFTHDFHSAEYTLTKRSIRTKLLYFLSDELLYSLLCGKSTIDIQDSLNRGDVIIFQIPKGASKFVSSVFGRLMIAFLNTLMLRRQAVELKDRKPVFLFIDEFQTLITQSLASSLQEIRKYKMSIVLATQSIKQIESATLKKTVMVNTGIKCIGLSDHQDRKEFGAEIGVSPEDLSKLQPLQFMIKQHDGKSQAFLFRVKILGKEMFYEGKEKQKVLDYLVHQLGMYVKVKEKKLNEDTPPPPPPLATPPDKKQNNRDKDGDEPFNGAKPAF